MKPMTVQELIDFLSALPDDVKRFPVIYEMCSDFAELIPEDIQIVRAADKKVCHRPQNGYHHPYHAGVFPPGEGPKYVDCITLPGN